MQSAHKSNIWKLYLIALFGGFAFFYNAIETLYFRHFGLSFQQIGSLLSALLFTKLLLEIPTGVFADLYGRKTSLVVGSIVNFVAIALLVLGSSYPTFLLAFAVWGASSALNSGASDALMYDSLKELDLAKMFAKHKGRMASLFISIDIISGALGPLMFGYYVRLPFIISWVSVGIVLVLQLSLFEEKIARKQFQHPFREHFRTILFSLKIASRHKIFIWLTGFMLLFFIVNKVFAEIISGPFLIEIGYSLGMLSVIGLVGSLIQTVLTFFADKVEERLGDTLSLLGVIGCVSMVYVAFSLTRNVWMSTILVGLCYSLISFSDVIIQSYLNHSIESENRATMLSIGSMIVSLMALITLPFFGSFADTYSTMMTFWLLGGITFVGGIILLCLKPNSPGYSP